VEWVVDAVGVACDTELLGEERVVGEIEVLFLATMPDEAGATVVLKARVLVEAGVLIEAWVPVLARVLVEAVLPLLELCRRDELVIERPLDVAELDRVATVLMGNVLLHFNELDSFQDNHWAWTLVMRRAPRMLLLRVFISSIFKYLRWWR
jgi:hypothetical protein